MPFLTWQFRESASGCQGVSQWTPRRGDLCVSSTSHIFLSSTRRPVSFHFVASIPFRVLSIGSNLYCIPSLDSLSRSSSIFHRHPFRAFSFLHFSFQINAVFDAALLLHSASISQLPWHQHPHLPYPSCLQSEKTCACRFSDKL